MELPMSETNSVSPLRQRMIEDMVARKLNPHTQRSHIHGCKRFAAWLKHSPDTATPDEVRRFQLHLIESGASICNRNRIITGVRFLFRVTLRRRDLAAEVWHIKEPQKLPPEGDNEQHAVKEALIDSSFFTLSSFGRVLINVDQSSSGVILNAIPLTKIRLLKRKGVAPNSVNVPAGGGI